MLVTCGSAVAQPPAAADAERAAAIVAAHKKIDDEYGRARMSPFTAVAVQYFEPGQTNRLGVSASGAAFDPAETMTDVIEMTLEAGSFVMSPVAGTKPPVVLGKNAEGDVVISPGRPLKARTKSEAPTWWRWAATSSSRSPGPTRATSGC